MQRANKKKKKADIYIQFKLSKDYGEVDLFPHYRREIEIERVEYI